ncbi:hypothetical protein NTGM5_110016 [Candidatus Nitrotoga sp. M5]|nr:hypothetical protein NTGM5_110016 [Candidatus Nitrotoga sp. M5]
MVGNVSRNTYVETFFILANQSLNIKQDWSILPQEVKTPLKPVSSVSQLNFNIN